MDIPAFPDMQRLQLVKNAGLSNEQRETVYMESRGMTLRDYFAAKAMAAYASSENWRMDMANDATARCAYAMADAMLKARES
jgi:hypothetical protein